MKTSAQHIGPGQRGFTLIEILVTIIISAILATILAQVVSSQTARSYAPIQVIDENLALRAAMEDITAEYHRLVQAGLVDLTSFRNDIVDNTFWNTGNITHGVNILAAGDDCYCITIDPVTGEVPANCTDTAAVLKVTLSAEGTQHRLTALFAP